MQPTCCQSLVQLEKVRVLKVHGRVALASYSQQVKTIDAHEHAGISTVKKIQSDFQEAESNKGNCTLTWWGCVKLEVIGHQPSQTSTSTS